MRTRATPLHASGQKPERWQGKYFADGEWHVVRDDAGEPVIFPNATKAENAAYWAAP